MRKGGCGGWPAGPGDFGSPTCASRRSWMGATEESYDSGDEVTAVGYVGASADDDNKVFMARLNLVPVAAMTESTLPIWHELGPVTIDPTGLGGYLSHRVSLTLTLPDDLAPGTYEVSVRTGPDDYFGDLIGLLLTVGMEAPYPMSHEWPLDEPFIAELPDDAIITGPGFMVSAADLRAGRYPGGAEAFMLNPPPDEPATDDVATSPSLITEMPRVMPMVTEPEPVSVGSRPPSPLRVPGPIEVGVPMVPAPPAETSPIDAPVIGLVTILVIMAGASLIRFGVARARRLTIRPETTNEPRVPTKT